MVLEGNYLETANSSIISANPPVSSNVEFAGIFGLNPFAFFLIIFVVGLVLIVFARIWWNQRQREKNRQVAKRRVLCEFCGEGWAESVLCEVFKGQVKRIDDKTRSAFNVEKFLSPKLSSTHEGEALDFYFWLPDHAFPVDWPEGKPVSQQIRVMKSHYYINDPMPKITYRPQEWNAEVYERVTSTLLKYAQDEKVAEVAVGELSGKFQMFETALRYMKNIPIMFILQLVACFMLLIVAVLGYLNMSAANIIKAFLVGK